MSELLQEAIVTCPYCWERITLVIDLSVESQDYIEDCFVCCQPIQIAYATDAGELLTLDVASTGG
jgi:hypothetical protein